MKKLIIIFTFGLLIYNPNIWIIAKTRPTVQSIKIQLKNAVEQNKIEALKRLIKTHKNTIKSEPSIVNQRGTKSLASGFFPLLHVAIRNHNKEIVETLIKNDANINIKNSFGRTALEEAIYCKDRKAIVTTEGMKNPENIKQIITLLQKKETKRPKKTSDNSRIETYQSWHSLWPNNKPKKIFFWSLCTIAASFIIWEYFLKK